MGNLCIKDYNHRYNDKVTCYKCGDKFYTDSGGVYSPRRSCRQHNFDNNNVCKICNTTRLTSGSGCFHVKEYRWYNLFTG